MTRNEFLDVLAVATEYAVYAAIFAALFWMFREMYRSIVMSLRVRKALDENLPPLFESKGDRRARLQAELDKLDSEDELKRARAQEKEDRDREREIRAQERADTRARREAEGRVIEDI